MTDRTLLLLMCLVGLPVRAKLLADEVPFVGTALHLDTGIELPRPFTVDSAGPGIDGHVSPDIVVTLIQGRPAVHGPNMLLRTSDGDLQLSADLAPCNSGPQYYSFGQPLACNRAFAWRTDNITVLGDHGGLSTIGSSAIHSL